MTGQVEGRRVYTFGPFRLMPDRQMLLRDGVPVRIGGRALDILAVLVERPGEVVSKWDLTARVWPNLFVEEGNLKVNMNALRRALGEARETPLYIATVVGRGYRFVATVEMTNAGGAEQLVVAPDNNLPAAATRIVGRSEVIEAICDELAGTRLVSIVGAGGVGKTTVALAVAERFIGSARDGVWLADLSPLRDPALVANAIATAFGLQAHSANMLAAVVGFLRQREVLLVLDSCEHLVEAVADCVDRILAEAPGVRILATSREPLRIKGEKVRRLPGLDTPPTGELTAAAAMEFSAVQLFVDRATDQLESFGLQDADAPVIAEICRRLDGLALAIELAATRVDTFGIRGLLAQLDDRFPLLQGHRAGVVRHRTLHAAIEWSYDLLSDLERRLMRRLSVFAGTFGLDSATAITGEDRGELSVRFADLVAKSLISLEPRDEAGYRLLDTTRVYALERLEESGEGDSVRRAHAEHFLQQARLAGQDAGRLPREAWIAKHGTKIDEIREAVRWSLASLHDATLGINLTVAAIPIWKRLSLIEECRAAVDRALDDRFASHRDPRDDLMLNLTLGATLLHIRGPLLQVRTALDRALELAEGLADADLQLECLRGLSEYELWTGDSRSAMSIAEKTRELETRGQPSARKDADAQAGSALSWLGALAAARHRLEGIVHRPIGRDLRPDAQRFEFDQRLTARGALATVLWLQGFPDQAVAMTRLQLAEAEASNYAISLCYALVHGSAVVAMYVRDYPAATRYFEQGMDHAARHGLNIWLAMATGAKARLDLYTGRPIDLAASREALAEVRESGFRMRYPNYLTNYGEALARQGDVDGGLAAMDEAMELSRGNGQVVGIPEMLRIKGNTLRFGRPVRWREAAACYTESLDLARRDGSLAWELRSAMSLVKLWRPHGGDAAAEDALATVFGRFTEGYWSGDLRQARALIDTREA